MSRDTQTAAIMSAGMKLLRDNLGVVEAEIFVSHIASNNFEALHHEVWAALPTFCKNASLSSEV